MIWVALYPFVFTGLRAAWRRHPQGAFLILITSGAICAFYAVACGNIGLAYRMRTQVWVLWAPLMGWGWYNWQRGMPRR
jgi:hypothetical protein